VCPKLPKKYWATVCLNKKIIIIKKVSKKKKNALNVIYCIWTFKEMADP